MVSAWADNVSASADVLLRLRLLQLTTRGRLFCNHLLICHQLEKKGKTTSFTRHQDIHSLSITYTPSILPRRTQSFPLCLFPHSCTLHPLPFPATLFFRHPAFSFLILFVIRQLITTPASTTRASPAPYAVEGSCIPSARAVSTILHAAPSSSPAAARCDAAVSAGRGGGGR